jgi:hypothetical protein
LFGVKPYLSLLTFKFTPEVGNLTTVADKGHSRTKSEITPQYHETRQQMRDSRHNFTIHATIPRFTPQFHDSRHKETADQSRSQYSLNSLFPAFSRNRTTV